MNTFGDFSKEVKAVEDAITENNIAIVFGTKETSKYGDAAKTTADTMRSYKMTMDGVTDSSVKLKDETENLGNSLTNIGSPLQTFIDSLGEEGLAKTIEQTTVGAMKKFEDSIVESLKAGKLSFKNFADYVVEQLLRIAIQQMILKPITGKFESFFEGFGDLFSAEGGGYTGMGARAGGVDGRGGFPAILHPNETVIDHNQGQGMGATVNFNISTVDAAGFDQLLASRKGLITSIINNAMNNQGKMGVV
jgi:phage-related minor tail protein